MSQFFVLENQRKKIQLVIVLELSIVLTVYYQGNRKNDFIQFEPYQISKSVNKGFTQCKKIRFFVVYTIAHTPVWIDPEPFFKRLCNCVLLSTETFFWKKIVRLSLSKNKSLFLYVQWFKITAIRIRLMNYRSRIFLPALRKDLFRLKQLVLERFIVVCECETRNLSDFLRISRIEDQNILCRKIT